MELDRTKIEKSSFIFFLGILILNGCSPVKKLDNYLLNPVEYVFNANTEQLRKGIIDDFEGLKYNEMALYYRGGKRRYLPDNNVLNEQQNHDDFLLEPIMGKAIGESHVYKRRGKALPYSAAFHLHLLKQDSLHTKIIVNTLSPHLILGTKLLPSLPHFGKSNKTKTVKASTVEEYEILYRIGKAINQTMPEVKYPNEK